MRIRPLLGLPLVAFAVLVLLLGRGLQLDAHELPSPLIGKPAPAFNLQRLDAPGTRFVPAQMRGKVWVLNVWASWCAPCRAELPAVQALAEGARVSVVGLNYKDSAEGAREWLKANGNPYAFTALDTQGKAGIDWGVYGVPETFVIDQRGVVRHKHTGPLTPETVRKELLPLIERLNRG
ncbi:DsbE family thiol:disulfide interchange protein [uncultured Azohydromonas sp.]|jgi:periplasmic protein thiol:disulfide oxidoreductases, DsbE subfamily|uniref:DsbE family thiol:disulfide interchange protein n=1 Tax=uncultured Azohydromonas sp. TaxID=487342 RepID=UPI00261DB580|nr:DsbE family thiol:disulfide interchange protein [uncultured Azohydromonas sp.]